MDLESKKHGGRVSLCEVFVTSPGHSPRSTSVVVSRSSSVLGHPVYSVHLSIAVCSVCADS